LNFLYKKTLFEKKGYNYEVLHPELIKNPPKVRTEKYDSNPPNLPMSVYAFIHSFGIVATAYWLLKSEETTIIIILSGLLYFCRSF
jgi:hypothetical protein